MTQPKVRQMIIAKPKPKKHQMSLKEIAAVGRADVRTAKAILTLAKKLGEPKGGEVAMKKDLQGLVKIGKLAHQLIGLPNDSCHLAPALNSNIALLRSELDRQIAECKQSLLHAKQTGKKDHEH